MNKYYLKIFAWIARKTLVNKFLRDHKSSIISFLGIITGIIEFLSDGIIYDAACRYMHFFCNFTSKEFYGLMIGGVSIFAQVANAERSLQAIERAKMKAAAKKLQEEEDPGDQEIH